MDLDRATVHTLSGAVKSSTDTERKRSLVVLMLRQLRDVGYRNAYQALCRESGLSLDLVDVADNVCLPDVLIECGSHLLCILKRSV
jgi:hypothetical protein